MEEWSRTLTLLLLDQRTAPSQYLGEDAPTSIFYFHTHISQKHSDITTVFSSGSMTFFSSWRFLLLNTIRGNVAGT